VYKWIGLHITIYTVDVHFLKTNLVRFKSITTIQEMCETFTKVNAVCWRSRADVVIRMTMKSSTVSRWLGWACRNIPQRYIFERYTSLDDLCGKICTSIYRHLLQYGKSWNWVFLTDQNWQNLSRPKLFDWSFIKYA